MANLEEATASGVAPLHTLISETSHRLLDTNHKFNHIFFGPHHFHNHLPHAILTYQALGASPERLEEEYKKEVIDLEPITVEKKDDITIDTWREYIGQADLYVSYLKFFDREVSHRGILGALIEYALDTQLMGSIISGAVHPLIHLGFGVEFQSPHVLAEGLAEACVHSPACAPLLQSLNQTHLPGKRVLDIIQEVSKDKTLDGMIHPDEEEKTDVTIKLASEKIREYLSHYYIEPTAESIKTHLRESFRLSAALLSTSGFNPILDDFSRVKLDFFSDAYSDLSTVCQTVATSPIT